MNLASGELAPSLFPSEDFQQILAGMPFNEHLGYDHPHGNERLRDAIAAMFMSTGKSPLTPILF